MEINPEFEKRLHAAVKAADAAKAQGNAEQFEAAAVDMLRIATEAALQNPTPDILLFQKAKGCEATRDWLGAEIAYRERLAMVEAERPGVSCFHPQKELCHFLLLLGRAIEAREQSERAWSMVRASEISMVRWMALDLRLRCELASRVADGVLAIANQALELVEPEFLEDLPWGTALVRRAQCQLALGNPWAAETDLERCRKALLDSKVGASLPGYVASIADWWEAQASCASQKGSLSEAIEAWTHAAQIRRAASAQFCDEDVYRLAALAKCLDHLSTALDLGAVPEQARDVRIEATALWVDLALPLNDGPKLN